MKKISILITIIFTSALSYGQQTMTISHSGLSPSSELTVNIGESIEFIHGGGGSHPMTEGWNSGEESTPVDFETQTVTSSNTSTTFTLDDVGTYYFHCGTNPGNQNNWGKIIVVDSTVTPVDTSTVDTTATTIYENINTAISFYPNPAKNLLYTYGLTNEAIMYNMKGEKVLTINKSVTDISLLSNGLYYIKLNNGIHKFIKQ